VEEKEKQPPNLGTRKKKSRCGFTPWRRIKFPLKKTVTRAPDCAGEKLKATGKKRNKKKKERHPAAGIHRGANRSVSAIMYREQKEGERRGHKTKKEGKKRRTGPAGNETTGNSGNCAQKAPKQRGGGN